MTASSHFSLQHTPRGVDHPYERSPGEREPRDPIAGHPVALGVETSPPGVAQAVTIVWQVNGGPENTVAATREQDSTTATLWRATLPPLAAGDRVTYRFVASPGETATASFEFTVAGWRTVGRVLSWRTTPRSLIVNCEHGLQVAISCERPDTIRFRLSLTPEEPREEGKPETFVLKEADDRLVVETAKLRCVVHRNPYRLEVISAQEEVLFAESPGGGLTWLAREVDTLRLVEHWMPPLGEAFFGFGMRFNTFDQRGETMDTLVFDQYKNQDRRTYLPVPFFVSSRGYGVYLATSRRTYFDLAASESDRAWFAVEGPSLDFYLFVGQPKEILSAFTDLVGKPLLPPKWAFGLWMSGNEWNSQAVVLKQIALTERHRIPATVMVVEAWSDESTFYIFNDAHYSPKPGTESFGLTDFDFPPAGRWPDPKGLADELHQRGLKLILWQIPVLKTLDAPHAQQDQDVAHALEQGYVVQEADGTPYHIRPGWFRGGWVPDFTNPNAELWWLAKRTYLVNEVGVDGFKTDGGEHLWGDNLRFADGRRGAEVNNLFPNLYQASYRKLAGAGRVLFSRAGFAGVQAESCHWAGDENSTFEAFRHSITAGLTAGASGLAFWGWDIAGFSGEIPSAELYLRATAMAAFCPIMQYHSEFNEHRQPSRDRTPWNIQERTGDPDVITVFRFYANLRMNLLPYIWSEAIKASLSGLPLMRALPFEFPDDPQVYNFPFQYLFGESLLIAPVAWEGYNSLEIYLPQGDWYDFWSGERHTGSKKLRYPTPKNIIPVFVRAGSVIALNLDESFELGSHVGNGVDKYHHLCFRVYPSRRPTHFEWFEDPASAPITFEVHPYE